MSALPVVYVIDDNAAVREVITMAFRRQHMTVLAFADGGTALEHFSKSAPDAVISDINMPGTTGFDVCHSVRRHSVHSTTPVILISGNVDKAVADQAHEAGADELIRKPFLPQDLVTRVRQLLYSRNGVLPADVPVPAPQPAAIVPPSHPASPAAARQNVIAEPVPRVTQDLSTADPNMLRIEILRLEGLVRKLEAELKAAKDYTHALEEHIKSAQRFD